MTVEIGTEASQFPEKEYINGIFVALHASRMIRQRVFHRIHTLIATARIFPYRTGLTLSPMHVFVLNVFNVGHPSEA
jgi:hypothetical protein